jgi:murein DD-endopeptidase MepM/ murein hydrolase activator NlpD
MTGKLFLMGKLKLIFTNLLTAVIVAAATSAFWIYAYGNEKPAVVSPTAANEEGEKLRIEVGPTGLVVPVAGVKASDLIDTYKQARAGGARVHDAMDIMAPHGTPVVAAAPGKVEKLFYSKGGGGITVYVRSPDSRYIFYYAHLQEYAPGLSEGQVVKQGDRLGTVGSSGNASPSGPHLHFAVHRMDPQDDWHDGRPVNPYPLLVGDPTGR